MRERTAVLFVVVGTVALLTSSSLADTYRIWDDWGGTWADAEKTIENTDDDLLCWAAATSNILEYTRWGQVGGMTTTDDMFAYFQDHWTDQAGNSYYGFDWWWDGTNDRDSAQDIADGWAQEDVDGGGGFYPTLNIDDYRRWSGDSSTALSTLDSWMHDGYGTTISIAGGMAHAITAWGFEYDPAATGTDYYTGIWVTDSDDDKNNSAGGYPDNLVCYDLFYSGGRWYLDGGYYGTGSTNYISEVCGLQINPVPIPGAVLLGVLGLGVAGYRLRRN